MELDAAYGGEPSALYIETHLHNTDSELWDKTRDGTLNGSIARDFIILTQALPVLAISHLTVPGFLQ